MSMNMTFPNDFEWLRRDAHVGVGPHVPCTEGTRAWWLSPTGNNANAGTRRTAAKATWSGAGGIGSVLADGDTVFILPGVYNPDIFLINRSNVRVIALGNPPWGSDPSVQVIHGANVPLQIGGGVSNFEIAGIRASSAVTNALSVAAGISTRAWIHDCMFEGDGNSFLGTNLQSSVIERCRASPLTGNGFGGNPYRCLFIECVSEYILGTVGFNFGAPGGNYNVLLRCIDKSPNGSVLAAGVLETVFHNCIMDNGLFDQGTRTRIWPKLSHEGYQETLFPEVDAVAPLVTGGAGAAVYGVLTPIIGPGVAPARDYEFVGLITILNMVDDYQIEVQDSNGRVLGSFSVNNAAVGTRFNEKLDYPERVQAGVGISARLRTAGGGADTANVRAKMLRL